MRKVEKTSIEVLSPLDISKNRRLCRGMDKISRIRDVINLWPTRNDLAKDLMVICAALKVTTAQVHKWAENDSIPAKYHNAVLKAARNRGFAITAEQIVILHDPDRRAA